VAALVVAGIAFISAIHRDREVSYASAGPAASPAPGRATVAAARHLLLRHTIVDQNYSRLSVAPLEARGVADRQAADLACARVSYAGDRGICLQAIPGLFTAYKAVFFDRELKPLRTIALEGRPSRTRVSPDGRVGA